MEPTVIRAGSTQKRTTINKMADRYKVDRSAAYQWSQEEGFPHVLSRTGQGNAAIYDADEVDAFVRQNHFAAWLQSREGNKNPLNLPDGGPRDLLTLKRIGELEGRALGRPATEVATLRTYISKGILAKPDREPDDGQRPTVTQQMWHRETAYAYISRPRRRVRRTAVEREAPAYSDEDLLDLELPEGSDDDLLTLEQVRHIDGHARGWGKPTAASTMKKLQGQGLLPKPDRMPGDGLEPPVEKPAWLRSTASRFWRRPGRLGVLARRAGSSRAEGLADEKPLLDLELPAGADDDLLNLQQIGRIDGRVRRRGRATSWAEMRAFLFDGVLDEPDRTPEDGLEPPVKEASWYRSTASRFWRRPGQLGSEQ
ncbi:MAG: hypothetical protein JO362_04125 [Streptomycetaceae bacterium]|nr:hypothetical protein [Streptomycetaceae bacterium]